MSWFLTVWERWVDRCHRPVDARPLALVRILVAAVILVDQLDLAFRGLLWACYRHFDYGGITTFHDPHYIVDTALGEWSGVALWGVVVLCMSCVLTGVLFRPATLLGVLAYAQMGHLFPGGDRAIDRILRTTLLILMFSGCERCWSLSRKPRAITLPAWSQSMLRWFMALVYMNTGWAKFHPIPGRWLDVSGDAELYQILVDPMSSTLDPEWWAPAMPLFHVAGVTVPIMEILAFLILIPKTRQYWAVWGAMMHLGIAATMSLGVFSWGMLALYPVMMTEWLIKGLDRLQAVKATDRTRGSIG